MSVIKAYESAPTGEVIDLGSISAAGGASNVLDLLKLDGTFATGVVVQSTVALSTSSNLTMRIEGSVDNESWSNLDDSGVDTSISESGASLFSFDNFPVAPIRYVRAYMVSEVGGSGAVITNKAMVGG